MGSTGRWVILLCLPLAGNAQTELELLTRSGNASYLQGDYEAARRTFEQAFEIAEKAPRNDSARYDILKRLAAVEAAAGQTEEADGTLRQAINWRQNQFGENDAIALNDMLEDASLCRVMHDYDRALAIIEQVLGAHISANGYDNAFVAADFSRAAQAHLDLKEPEKASIALEASLDILTKLNSEDHPSLLPNLDRLGEVRIALRQYDKAESVYQRALVIRERTSGKEHADLLTALDGLAYSLLGQKKYAQAEPVYQRLLALWVSSAGKEHPMVAVTLDKVAVFYREQQKWVEGQEAADRANAIRAHFLASGLAQEATERLTENKKGEAVELDRRALAVLDPPHPVFEELRKQIEESLKSMETPAPRRRKPAPKASK
jgi:tetratricopeptide (TPR) repeat protein